MPVERFASGGIYEDEVGYSRVVVASGYGGHTGWTAGTTSMVNGAVAHIGDAQGQAAVAFQAALFALERAGFSRADTVQTRMYVVAWPPTPTQSAVRTPRSSAASARQRRWSASVGWCIRRCLSRSRWLRGARRMIPRPDASRTTARGTNRSHGVWQSGAAR
jgi:enamine deaminase RidA (YjgF/YER057c/UK114 family)